MYLNTLRILCELLFDFSEMVIFEMSSLNSSTFFKPSNSLMLRILKVKVLLQSSQLTSWIYKDFAIRINGHYRRLRSLSGFIGLMVLGEHDYPGFQWIPIPVFYPEDTSSISLSANRFGATWASANQRPSWKPQFENPP